MKLTAGSRWRSAVCDTEAVIVRPPKDEGLLQCGGAAMLPSKEPRPADLAPDPSLMDGSLLGKRYTDDAGSIEVLCTKAGQGTLGFSGHRLAIREAKKLPSSD